MIYGFGDYDLDVERYQLRWRGDELELEPKVFEVLAYLVRHRDRVVPKSELLEQLWPDQIVGEWSLTRCISMARKAVQDSPHEQRAIRTLYGRGYRFVADVEERDDPPTPRASPVAGDAPAAPQPGRPLIGRERPFAELSSALDASLGGRGRVLLVTGETGIGKTRLLEELAAIAAARGAAVRVGRCWESEGAPAYWPWVQILRAEARGGGRERLRELMGSGAAEIAQMLPDLGDELGELPRRPPAEPRQARFRLFDALARLTRRIARDTPLVLLLEDLHRADEPSLRLLEFLSREITSARVLLVGSYRDEELARDPARSRIIGELARACSAQHLRLEGLSPDDVARFVAKATGRAPAPAVAQALHQQTGGNPFFLTQVLPLLNEEGALPSCGEDQPLDLTLPRGVRQAILRQLDGLSSTARQLLEVASVQGRQFSLGVLERAAELDLERVLAATAELVQSGLALEEPEWPGRFRFTHALIRDTLYAELSPGERAGLHHRLGQALESVHGGNDSAQLPALAHHYSEARRVGGEKKALDYAIAAARWARERLAYEEACRYLERALDLLELQAHVDEALRCDLLLDLGEAKLRAGEPAASRATLQRAAELARGLHEPERLARAAIATAMSHHPLARGIVDEQVIALLEVALARLPERDSALRARLLVCMVIALYWVPEAHERCTMLCEQALAMARRVGDPSTLLFTMSAVMSARWGPDFVEERAALASEAIRVGQDAGVKEELLDARVQRLIAWLELGRMEAVDQELAEISRLTSELHANEAEEYLPWFQATRAIMNGRFDVGERLSGQFLEDVQKRGDETAMTGFGFQFIILRWVQGRCDELLELVRELSERNRADDSYRGILVRVLCECGRDDEARRELERLMPGDLPRMPKNLGWLPTVALLAESCAMLGDPRRCQSLYRELAPYARRHVATAAGYMGSVSRYLGVLASELQRPDMAERHFAVALELETRIGARPSVAWTGYYLARMRYRSGDPRAEQTAREALEQARELGIPALTERIQALAS